MLLVFLFVLVYIPTLLKVRRSRSAPLEARWKIFQFAFAIITTLLSWRSDETLFVSTEQNFLIKTSSMARTREGASSIASVIVCCCIMERFHDRDASWKFREFLPSHQKSLSHEKVSSLTNVKKLRWEVKLTDEISDFLDVFQFTLLFFKHSSRRPSNWKRSTLLYDRIDSCFHSNYESSKIFFLLQKHSIVFDNFNLFRFSIWNSRIRLASFSCFLPTLRIFALYKIFHAKGAFSHFFENKNKNIVEENKRKTRREFQVESCRILFPPFHEIKK